MYLYKENIAYSCNYGRMLENIKVCNWRFNSMTNRKVDHKIKEICITLTVQIDYSSIVFSIWLHEA